MDIIDINEEKLEKRDPELLKILIKDNSTGQNIKWATDNYLSYGFDYAPECEIKVELITGVNKKLIQPRICKSQDEQTKRTKDKAEVFTPSWVCNEQNNLVDERWFDRKNIFNTVIEKGWITNLDKIPFSEEKDWKSYIDARRLEVSCGEAPYLVSRYDTVTGEFVPVKERIGLLDRKLRVINENTIEMEEWYKWVVRAFQSIYGYEYQGDNVLLARENLLYTFVDNMLYKFDLEPTLKQMKEIAKIISWNIWQMDGIKLTAPYSEAKPLFEQLTLFELDELTAINDPVYCKIFDWRSNCSMNYKDILNGG
ncbi:MAG: hypothetical protein ABS949_12035 [Solibacillus sp.]